MNLEESYQKHLTLVNELKGKTITNSKLDKKGDLVLTLDNGDIISVNYDCHGGVYLHKEYSNPHTKE